MPAPEDRTAAALATLDVPVHRAIGETGDPATAYAERIAALFHLMDTAATAAGRCGGEILDCLARLLQDPHLGQRRQDLFLARKAAETLLVLTRSPRPPVAAGAWAALTETLRVTRGLSHRGTAETIGTLPCLDGSAPKTVTPGPRSTRTVAWPEVLAQAGVKAPFSLQASGRSLLVRNGLKARLLVIKRVRVGEDPDDLAREAGWMTRLADASRRFDCRFDVPEPLEFDGAHLVRLAQLPPSLPAGGDAHPDRWAICYIAPEAYFVYPNDARHDHRPAPAAFVEIMARGARLMGALAACGIVHEAPIPLFHNRAQRHRRRDGGRYEWFRGGRLDRWLASCAYPNWGPTGLRDFEHLVGFRGQPLHLYRHLGNHFLSLLLVAGSYFRAHDHDRVGRRPDGRPVDARDLFDAGLLARVVEEIYCGYYRGFVGKTCRQGLPLDAAALTARMIEEMGVDRHMEEILRPADQQAMSDEQFCAFLAQRGFASDQIAAVRRGEQDLTMFTGPHLGGFNQTISLPELITAVEGMAAACIAARHRFCRGTAQAKGATSKNGH